jgi:type IV secretion system protein TrbL
MKLGFFLGLLTYGPTWLPWIIESFQMLGQELSGTGGLSPGDIFARGDDISGQLMLGAGLKGIFSGPGAGLAVLLAAACVAVSFVLIAGELLIVLIESGLAISAGLIFLGFGASRWTRPFVQKLIEFCVSSGTKLLVLYLCTGIGMKLSDEWLAWATSIWGGPGDGAMSSWSIALASLLFCLICWRVPKACSQWAAGATHLSAGEMGASMVHSAMHLTYAATLLNSVVSKFTAATKATDAAKTTTAGSAANGANGLGGAAPGAVPPPNGGSGASNVPPPKPPSPGPAGSVQPPQTDAAATLQSAAKILPPPPKGNE